MCISVLLTTLHKIYKNVEDLPTLKTAGRLHRKEFQEREVAFYVFADRAMSPPPASVLSFLTTHRTNSTEKM